MNRFFLMVFGLSLGSCTFDPGAAPTPPCVQQSDCKDQEICSSGYCVARPSSDAGNDLLIQPDSSNCFDNDGDGFFIGASCDVEKVDCDDTNGSIFPGAEETCSGVDSNCDGMLKEGCDCIEGAEEGCGSDVGVCQKGTRLCAQGKWGACVGEIAPGEEICGDEFDNNCDGNVNEACPCDAGETADCGTDIGACEEGIQRCVNGLWSECEGAILPSAELCDGVDNDCNGTPDDSPQGTGGACPTGEPGACAGGTIVCQQGSLVCEAINMGSVETCDGIDNDCDGDVDNDVVQNCSTACGPGTEVCAQGAFGACVPINPPEEVCDGIDNDCDTQVDESFPEDGATCVTGLPGICGDGKSSCVNGSLVCAPSVTPIVESCDGLDNDCDGLTDEELSGHVLMRACNGGCPNGAFQLCENGVYSACEYSDVEICNGSDSNCDALSDNRSACYLACPGGGIVRGAQTCESGGTTCTIPEEICGDGIDNDCDGVVDQNCNQDLDNMALVPNGTFLMGSRGDALAANDELPQHTVDLSSFLIDREEVSRNDYALCVQAGFCPFVASCVFSVDLSLPMTCLSYSDAEAYCAYVGKRLPTEAEWEKAARGPYRRNVYFPWGNSPNLALTNMQCAGSMNQCLLATDQLSAGASYYGVLNMSGNAAEMVQDYYNANFYTAGIVSDPLNDIPGSGRVHRGGSYTQNLEFGRVSNRAAGLPTQEVGFRCVIDF